MLSLVKLALRITTTAFDSEILMLIAACQEEMEGSDQHQDLTVEGWGG